MDQGISESSPFKEDLQDIGRKQKSFMHGSSYTDSTIHPSFPSMGVISPSHLGSKSLSPDKTDVTGGNVGDTEERLPSKFISENYYNKNK